MKNKIKKNYDNTNYLELKERKERYFNYILIIIILILLILMIIFINKTKYTSNNKDNVVAKVDNMKEEISPLSFLYDDKINDVPPNKKDNYVSDLVSCNNAVGIWNNKEWKLDLKNIVGKVDCSITFKKKTTDKKKVIVKKINNNYLNNKIANNIEVENDFAENENIEDNLDKNIVNNNINENISPKAEEVIKNKDNIEYTIEESNKEEIIIDDSIIDERYMVKENIKNKMYSIYRDEVENYIIGFEVKTKLNDILNSFDNNIEQLHFYNINNEEIIDMYTNVATGMKIKLIIDNIINDDLTIVVRGDINKDGIVNVADYKKLNKYINEEVELDYISKKAADVVQNDIIDEEDYNKIHNYVTKKISFLN